MTSRQFFTMFDPLPYRHAFYYFGLSTVVTESFTPSPPKTVTSFMDDPLPRKVEIFPKKQNIRSFFLKINRVEKRNILYP